MGVAIESGAMDGRSQASPGDIAGSPSIDPGRTDVADASAGQAGRCPELDCIRPLLEADAIDAAECRAATLGVGADRVLITAGELSEETYLRALAASLGLPFEPLDDTPRSLCPLSDERLIESAAAGMLPLAIADELYLVVAPRGAAARRILRLIAENPARAPRFRFTSGERLSRFVLRHTGRALAARAADELKRTQPDLSAAPRHWRAKIVPAAIVMLAALGAAVLALTGARLALEVTLAAIFLAWLGLRLAGAFVELPVRKAKSALPDDALPVYTIIAALYREASSVDGLLTAIERLDYPGIMAHSPQDIFRPAAI